MLLLVLPECAFVQAKSATSLGHFTHRPRPTPDRAQPTLMCCRADRFNARQPQSGIRSGSSMQLIFRARQPARGIDLAAVLGELSRLLHRNWRRKASSGEERAGRELEDWLSPKDGSAEFLKPSHLMGSKDFRDLTVLRDHDDGIPLVGRNPDVLRPIQCDAVVPSSRGCATKMLSRHSVSAVKVVSQPVGLETLPS